MHPTNIHHIGAQLTPPWTPTRARAPSQLYLNGLQRESFLPFITDLQQRCHVHELTCTTDYRTLACAHSGIARIASDDVTDVTDVTDAAEGEADAAPLPLEE